MLTAIYFHQQWAFFVLIEAKRAKKGEKGRKIAKIGKNWGMYPTLAPIYGYKMNFCGITAVIHR